MRYKPDDFDEWAYWVCAAPLLDALAARAEGQPHDAEVVLLPGRCDPDVTD